MVNKTQTREVKILLAAANICFLEDPKIHWDNVWGGCCFLDLHVVVLKVKASTIAHRQGENFPA